MPAATAAKEAGAAAAGAAGAASSIFNQLQQQYHQCEEIKNRYMLKQYYQLQKTATRVNNKLQEIFQEDYIDTVVCMYMYMYVYVYVYMYMYMYICMVVVSRRGAKPAARKTP